MKYIPSHFSHFSGSPTHDDDGADSKRILSVDSTSGGGVVGIIGDVIQRPTGEFGWMSLLYGIILIMLLVVCMI